MGGGLMGLAQGFQAATAHLGLLTPPAMETRLLSSV